MEQKRQIIFLAPLLFATFAGCVSLGEPLPQEIPLQYYTLLQKECYLPQTGIKEYCAVEAIWSILNYFGKSVSIQQIAEEIYRQEMGGSPHILFAPSVRKRGLIARDMQGSLDFLKKCISLQRPLVVVIDATPYGPNYHAIVIVGYSDRYRQIVFQHYDSRKKTLNFEEFLNRWKKTKFYCLLIYPPETRQEFIEVAAEFENMGMFEDAKEIYLKLLEEGEEMVAYIGLGNCLLNLGKFKEAINAYHRAIALEPRNPKALNNLANAYLLNRDFETAKTYAQHSVSIYRQLIKKDRDLWLEFVYALGTLGDVEFALKKFASALSAYQECLEYIKQVPELSAKRFYQIGLCYKAMGEKEKASASLQKALSLTKDNSLREKIEAELDFKHR